MLDVTVIHLRRTELLGSVIPSKLFECMGVGIPVLMGLKGEAAAIVQKEQTGLLFEPEDPVSLVEALETMAGNDSLRENLRTNAFAAAKNYDRVALAAKMLNELEAVAAKQESLR